MRLLLLVIGLLASNVHAFEFIADVECFSDGELIYNGQTSFNFDPLKQKHFYEAITNKYANGFAFKDRKNKQLIVTNSDCVFKISRQEKTD